MSFPARFASFCHVCEDQIEAGDEVRFDEGGGYGRTTRRVIHELCVEPIERPVTICEDCNLTIPCMCA